MNKAIQYREDGKFYLFDKPINTRPVCPSANNDTERAWRRYESDTKYYNDELNINLAAGKEIINPEVVVKHDYTPEGIHYTYKGKVVKPGDIFDCPYNIEFEEMQKPVYNIPDIEKDNSASYHVEKVIRLKLKEEVILTESQDELFNAVYTTIMGCEKGTLYPTFMEKLKSKFTIQRK